MPTEKLKGVMAIITWPDGDVLASVADFERSGFGGMKLIEAQSFRARQAVKFAALRALCHADIPASLDSYDAEKVIDTLIRRKGYKLSVIDIETNEIIDREKA